MNQTDQEWAQEVARAWRREFDWTVEDRLRHAKLKLADNNNRENYCAREHAEQNRKQSTQPTP